MKRFETETVINFNDAEPDAWITTRQRRIQTRMRKLGIEPYRKQGDYECYRVPHRWIKISPTKKVSEEQRNQARDRAKKSGLGLK